MERPVIEPTWQFLRLLDGFVTTQLIYVAAELGVAEHLADGPRHGADLAEAVGARAGPLTRVLRGLVTEGVLREEADGRFALTPVGDCLSTMRGAVQARGALYYASAAGLLGAVTDGGTPFEEVHGERFFDHLARRPELAATFQGSMAARAAQEAADVVAAYDFGTVARLVDVGGGSAVLLAAVLEAAPAAHGVLVDQPAAVSAAAARLAERGLAERSTCVVVDFFTEVPAGADAYVLSRVLHDWPDEEAVRILDVCRRATPPAARLLVVEALLPERALDCVPAVRMDLHMLMLFGDARERTEAEYRALLGAGGFDVRRVVPTASPTGLAVVEAVPA